MGESVWLEEAFILGLRQAGGIEEKYPLRRRGDCIDPCLLLRLTPEVLLPGVTRSWVRIIAPRSPAQSTCQLAPRQHIWLFASF
ncbi:hypothetical protein TZ03_00790 [Pseudomonas sp. 10-1B]|nr:hypothetical protein TZ03_00790 [Pseudomonas sp. 10-1B]